MIKYLLAEILPVDKNRLLLRDYVSKMITFFFVKNAYVIFLHAKLHTIDIDLAWMYY
jgi:hypothetical protein